MIRAQVIDIEFDISAENLDLREFDGYEKNLDENGEPTEEFIQECVQHKRDSLRDEVWYKTYYFDDEVDCIDEMLRDLISAETGWTVSYVSWCLV